MGARVHLAARMLSLPTHWPDIIAGISTRPEFQNATVRLEDPSRLTVDPSYDPLEDEEPTYTGDPLVYEGRARLIGINRGNQDSEAYNEKTIKAVRVQFPRNAFGRVGKGFKLYVLQADRNPALETYVFTPVSNIQGSNAAARTIEFAVDEDSLVQRQSPAGTIYPSGSLFPSANLYPQAV